MSELNWTIHDKFLGPERVQALLPTRLITLSVVG